MLHMGRGACDGRLEGRRCGACALAAYGMPPLLRDIVTRAPEALGDIAARAGLTGRALTALRLPGLVGAAQRGFRELMRKADRVVAVCLWARDVLRLNGVPDDKLLLCRQGLPRSAAGRAACRPAERDEPSPGILRLGYFGRLDRVKGIDILIDALHRIPEAKLHLDMYALRQAGSDAYASRIERRAGGDSRIAFRSALPPDAVRDAMQRCDIVAVPSRWLETGPLVVLEAFDAGTPVLGARLGGIAELVTDGEDGILVPPERPAAWAGAILDLADRPAEVARLRKGIRPPRTIDAVAGEMAELYRSLGLR
jgi:glycosyltransferase involved in cell wall biosynthesis